MVWIDGGAAVWKLTNYPRDDLHLRNGLSAYLLHFLFYLGLDKLLLLAQLSLAHNLVVVQVDTEEVAH